MCLSLPDEIETMKSESQSDQGSGPIHEIMSLSRTESPERKYKTGPQILDIPTKELWEWEHFQVGNVPLSPGLQTVWDQVLLFMGQFHLVTGQTIRDWWLSQHSGLWQILGTIHHLSNNSNSGDPSSTPRIRYTTGLWSRPVIRYRSARGTYRWTTSPARTGTGEPLHRRTGEPLHCLEPVLVNHFTD